MLDIRYTKDHEYIRIDGDTGTIGITDYAQGQLGDVVFVELPDIGKKLAKGEEAAVVESVKAASEVYAPVSGEVVAINQAIEEEPAKVNADPAGDGWFLKIRLADAAEDATAHVAHASRFFRRPLTIASILLILIAMTFGTFELARRGHSNAARSYGSVDSDPSEIRLGGVPYPIDRKAFADRLAKAQPEEIRKYFVEIGGRKFPVKQAVSVGLGAPRASFRTDAAIHALTKLGYTTQTAN